MGAIQARLDEVRRRHGLSSLYLIAADESGAWFGARPGAGSPSQALSSDLKNCLEAAGPDSPPPPERIEVIFDGAQEVEHVLRTRVVPYIEGDGGKLEVRSIDEKAGLIVVALSGACSGCPSSVMTLKAGIQQALVSALPWVREVAPSEPPHEPDFGFKLTNLWKQ